LDRMRDKARTFASRPLISIITPVFDTPVSRLEEAVQSVLTQAYENWELLLIDDGSADPDLLRTLPDLAGRDRRIVLANLGKHGGISAASNRGLELARGEWVTFLDHDDVLEPDALFQIVSVLQMHPIRRVLYHWRRSESSSAISVRQKPEQLDASRRAIEDHLKRRDETAHVAVDWRTHAFRVRRELSEPTKISIIIPNSHGDKELERCVETLTSKTDYPNYEILI